MKETQHIEVKSEIGAGTRGASLGIDALKIASINLHSTYFRDYEAVEVATENHVLFKQSSTPHAKYIDTIYEIEQRVCAAVSKTMELEKFPIILAGDHSTAAGTICGIKQVNPDKRLGVIWIDAHADLHTPYTTPSGNMHGMSLAMVTGTDNLECQINKPSEKETKYWDKIKAIGSKSAKINISDIVFIAARDLEDAEKQLLKKHNIRNFTTNQVRSEGIKSIAEQSMQQLINCDIIYISFDVDSMDSSLSVGTGTPVPGGLTVEEAIELNSLLVRETKVCAWEMVEVNPTLDTVNEMAENAMKVLEATAEAINQR